MKYLSKLLIKNVEIISAPDNEKYFLGIDNDTISVISKEMPTGFENAEIFNASDKIAVPGLVNTHTHAAMTLLRSYADDMVLMDWLQNKIWPAEAGLNDEVSIGAQCFQSQKCLKQELHVLQICILQWIKLPRQ